MRRDKVEIRVLSPGEIEEFHAHLLRLDRTSRFPRMDDRAIDAHCLRLMAIGAILVGCFVDGVMRASAEIIPDRTARRAEAAITIEDGYEDRDFEREITEVIVEQARRFHLHDLRVLDRANTRTYRIPPFELKVYAANG